MTQRQSFHLIWLALPACFLVALVGLLVPMPVSGRMAGSLGNMAHAPLFAGLTMLTLVLLQSLRPLPGGSARWVRRLTLIAVTMFVAGILVEWVQGVIGRSASIHDATANGLGILAATAWFVASGLSSPRSKRALQFLGAVLIGLSWWSPLEVMQDHLRVESDFPLIASFETPIELTRWHFDRGRRERTQSNVTEGEFALRWAPKDAPYPAMTLLEVASDWSAVETLELDIVLTSSETAAKPDRTWEVIVKVIDQDHENHHEDVAKHFVTLRNGEPQHVIFPRQSMVDGPQDRKLDMRRIKMVSVLIIQPGPGLELHLDHVHATLKPSAVDVER